VQDITESKKTSEKIKETNTALKVILDQRETEKIQQDKEMMSKLEALVLPYLEKLTNTPLDQEQKVYLELIRANIAGIFAPCAHGFKILGSRLTRTEMLVADMVKKGQTSQEIADLLRISVPAVYFHRNNIRQKLGLRGSRANLNSYLHSLD
jgi:DNA-binding CsgD family transcriptional regulator